MKMIQCSLSRDRLVTFFVAAADRAYPAALHTSQPAQLALAARAQLRRKVHLRHFAEQVVLDGVLDLLLLLLVIGVVDRVHNVQTLLVQRGTYTDAGEFVNKHKRIV